jgi:hypothetical protein
MVFLSAFAAWLDIATHILGHKDKGNSAALVAFMELVTDQLDDSETGATHRELVDSLSG